jgi:hypothetical protein
MNIALLSIYCLQLLIPSSVAWISSHASRSHLVWSNKRQLECKSPGQQLYSTKMTTIDAEIVGGGRIGSLLSEAGTARLLGRKDHIDPAGEGKPILIATRNDALASIVDNCPENRRKDLVFLQNGYLDNFLAENRLLDNTQVLLYMSVTAKGVPPIDGVTKVNPEGLTATTGIHAQAFADRLATLNMRCNVVSSEEYRPLMFEKLM